MGQITMNPLKKKNINSTNKTPKDKHKKTNSEEKEESEESSEINPQCINFFDAFCQKIK